MKVVQPGDLAPPLANKLSTIGLSAIVAGRRALSSAWRLAWRNLLQDRVRFILSVVAIALSLMLILFLLGLRAGVRTSAIVYLDNAPGPVAVLPPGGRTTSAGAAQFLPLAVVQEVASTPGVARVTPILLTTGFAELHGRKEAINLVGYDSTLGGGPWDIREGREPASEDEAVLDRVVAARHNLRIGDPFEVGGRSLTIAGFSNGTASWTGSYAFAWKATVESLVLAPGAASIVLVTPAPGTKPTDLAATLRLIPGTSVLLKRELMDNDAEVISGIADQVILLMVAAAFIVGALVVGMVIYTTTSERRAEYGILKAIGASNGLLYRVVVAQALVAGTVGAFFGIGLAFAMRMLVIATKPQFLVTMEPPAIAITVVAGLVMAVSGSVLPARSAGRMAPAEVFRR